jgi:hypothetical protein
MTSYLMMLQVMCVCDDPIALTLATTIEVMGCHVLLYSFSMC